MALYNKDGRIHEKIGQIDIAWPKTPPLSEIDGSQLPKEKQKFVRRKLPTSFRKLKKDKEGNILYTRQQLEFIDEEWDKLIDGYWFMNNGQPTYITCYHYFELTYWQIDIGFKEYRDRDRRVHLHWLACEQDPNCYGQIYLKHRRDGATYRATAVNYLTAIQHSNVETGIQSKTGADAGKVFKKLVLAWRKLPYFLQPTHEGTTMPKRALNFYEPAERIGKTVKKVKGSTALETTIDFAPTQPEAYDGTKKKFYHADEWGKCVEADVTETWRIVKECLTLGNKVVGKAMVTSTVAEMEKKGGKHFGEIWDQSNPTERNKNGRTTSGLYKLFIPAYDGREGFIDEYGMSLTKEAKEFIQNERDDLRKKGDQKGLAEYKRLYPFTEGEALTGSATHCEFDLEKIDTQLEWLNGLPLGSKPYVRGNFMWKDGIKDSKVIFVPKKNGVFKVAWRPIDEDTEMNEVTQISERIDLDEGTGQPYTRPIYKPEASHKHKIGIDPYDHNVVKSGKGSNAAGYVWRMYDYLDPHNRTDCFIVQYLHRPPIKDMFYEDMIKLCVYYGCEMLYETQKPGVRDYFEKRGYHKFLMKDPGVTSTKAFAQTGPKGADIGQSASTKTTQQITELHEANIFNNSDKIFFEELLEDLKVFDPSDTEKSDATMGSGYGLIAAQKRVKQKPKKRKLTSLIPMMDNSGEYSRVISQN